MGIPDPLPLCRVISRTRSVASSFGPLVDKAAWSSSSRAVWKSPASSINSWMFSRRPSVATRLAAEDGGTREWRSAALPRYARMTLHR